MNRRACLVGCLGLIIAVCGCGGQSQPPPVDNFDQQAKAKVDAFKRLVEAMQKDANGMDAKAALEEYRINMLDVSKHRAEAEEIVKLHQQKLKGKFQGEVAQEVQLEVTALEIGLRAKR